MLTHQTLQLLERGPLTCYCSDIDLCAVLFCSLCCLLLVKSKGVLKSDELSLDDDLLILKQVII